MRLKKWWKTDIQDAGNVELTANRYTIYCMSVAMIIVAIVWILDMFDIFVIDRVVTTTATLLFMAIFVIGRVVFAFIDLSKPCMKYIILTWAVMLFTILTTAFTFHAILACLVPIMYTAMYPSKKVTFFTYILMVVSICVTVYGGYYWGLCDANMALLTGKPLQDYIMPGNTFALTQINDEVPRTLTLYFVIPRCMICIVVSTVCRSISKIISANVTYAQKMEVLAEIDQMTGLYNKSKYLNMIGGGYRNEKQLAVIFWDINYLKTVNDTRGHEAGDRLILTIAKIIKDISTVTDKAYRIGGDEFVMILSGADEMSVQKKVEDWELLLAKANENSELPLSVSIGYAVGSGNDLDNIIAVADKMMYENKRMNHQGNL